MLSGYKDSVVEAKPLDFHWYKSLLASCFVQRYEQGVRQMMREHCILEEEGGGVWMEVQLKDTISAWKQHITPDHFSHDAANRPDINWKMKWQPLN